MLLCSTSLLLNVPLENAGEDATLCRSDRDNAALCAVLDGCGGSGGRKYARADNWSGAKLASRAAAQALDEWFNAVSGEDKPLQRSCRDIRSITGQYLSAAYESVREAESGIRLSSSMSLSLPTTLSAVTVQVPKDNTYRLRYYWAGDSRGYLFLPSALVQVTRDNTDDVYGGRESMEAFMDTNPNNVLSAGKDYTIFARELLLSQPCMVLVATDGCTSSLRHPAELEELLLRTLLASASPLDWEEKLKAAFGLYASDDYSLVLLVLGFQDFSALQNAYRSRAEEFETRCGKPLREALEQEDGDRLRQLWDAYRDAYLGVALPIKEAQS